MDSLGRSEQPLGRGWHLGWALKDRWPSPGGKAHQAEALTWVWLMSVAAGVWERSKTLGPGDEAGFCRP